MNPSPIEDAASVRYTQVNLEVDMRRKGRLAAVLDSIPLEAGRVLDIGCGPGVQFTGTRRRFQFTGIDISAAALEQARANGYETVQHDLAKPLPLPDASFDLAVATDILEHMTDPLALLREAIRVVHPGGRLLLSVPNHFFLANRLQILRGGGLVLPWGNHRAYEDWNYFHLRFFRRDSFCSLIAAAGLEIERDLSTRFLAPLPRILLFPGLRHLTVLLRRWAAPRHPDLWTQHFIALCRRP